MLLSKKNRQTLLGPLSRNNPVIVQVLGICSALAVTAKLRAGFCHGCFGNRRTCLFQCHHFVVAQHDTRQHYASLCSWWLLPRW